MAREMTPCSLDMLGVAASAIPFIPADARACLSSFVHAQVCPDGGFRGRSQPELPVVDGDLYYTMFGLECLRVLGEPLPVSATARYLAGVRPCAQLDLVHMACLARCEARCAVGPLPPARLKALRRGLERHRAADGGFGSVYGCFLARLASEDLGLAPDRDEAMLRCIDHSRTLDQAYANAAGEPQGLTPTTAAAVVLRRRLGAPRDEAACEWLLARQHSGGGFAAGPLAPLPDLLSTATALYALRQAGISFDTIRDNTLDFVERLWHESGGLHASLVDVEPDCEYTFYGLLALGCLAP